MILNRASSVVRARIGLYDAPIQQIKAAGVTGRGSTTQGLPIPVTNLSVSVAKSGSNRLVRVSFTQNPNDPYFTAADLYVKQGSNNATLVAMGSSPILVTLPASPVPTTLIVASSGNWGTLPLAQSPGIAVSLA